MSRQCVDAFDQSPGDCRQRGRVRYVDAREPRRRSTTGLSHISVSPATPLLSDRLGEA